MAKYFLIGVSKFTSKAGKPLEVINIQKPFTEDQYQKGSLGNNTEQIFLPEKLHGKIRAEHIGKEITLTYDVSNGRAYLNDFSFK